MSVRIVTDPDQGDAEAVLVAAELHPDKVILDCVSVAKPSSDLVPNIVDGRPARLELQNDLGTVYTFVSGGGSGEEG